MHKKSPYDVIKTRHVTEKSRVLEELQHNQSNPSVRLCNAPKYVFLVDRRSNKQEIAQAIEEIYAEKKIRVTKVNTIYVKPKKTRVRGREGEKQAFKKAIVTLEPGDVIEDEQAPSTSSAN